MFPWVITFLLAFVMNVVWENAHSILYTNFRGSEITQSLLIFMALKDAILICVLIALATYFPRLKRNALICIVSGAFLFSVLVEWHALATNRWAYATSMPIVPLLGTGVTPTVQLAILGALSYAIFRSTSNRIA